MPGRKKNCNQGAARSSTDDYGTQAWSFRRNGPRIGGDFSVLHWADPRCAANPENAGPSERNRTLEWGSDSTGDQLAAHLRWRTIPIPAASTQAFRPRASDVPIDSCVWPMYSFNVH